MMLGGDLLYVLSASKGYSEDLIRPGIARLFGNGEWQCCPRNHRYYLALLLELVLDSNKSYGQVKMSQRVCGRAWGCMGACLLTPGCLPASRHLSGERMLGRVHQLAHLQ